MRVPAPSPAGETLCGLPLETAGLVAMVAFVASPVSAAAKPAFVGFAKVAKK